jgi:hypothetical protein
MRHRDKESGNDGQLMGRYANYFEIGHNAFEFLFDLGQLYFGEPEARIHTRIVTSPAYAKMLVEILHEAISQYEQSHGRISPEADESEERVKHLVRVKESA